MYLLYVLHFTKGLENQEGPGWPEVIGFILGFGFGYCFSRFDTPDFFSVPVLEYLGLPGFVQVPGNPLLFVSYDQWPAMTCFDQHDLV